MTLREILSELDRLETEYQQAAAILAGTGDPGGVRAAGVLAENLRAARDSLTTAAACIRDAYAALATAVMVIEAPREGDSE